MKHTCSVRQKNTRTFYQVVTLWYGLEEFMEVRIPLVAGDRKAGHRHITVVEPCQQIVVLRIVIVKLVVVAVDG
jgi:hypothetical protein